MTTPDNARTMTTGYSGTPLAKKLGLKDGFRVTFHHMPASVRADISRASLSLAETTTAPLDLIHIFATSRAELAATLADARNTITQNGTIWASWPKKASKLPTDITEDTIRDLAFPLGLVDVKVCAVDEVWSGLKLVIRKELRGQALGKMLFRK